MVDINSFYMFVPLRPAEVWGYMDRICANFVFLCPSCRRCLWSRPRRGAMIRLLMPLLMGPIPLLMPRWYRDPFKASPIWLQLKLLLFNTIYSYHDRILLPCLIEYFSMLGMERAKASCLFVKLSIQTQREFKAVDPNPAKVCTSFAQLWLLRPPR